MKSKLLKADVYDMIGAIEQHQQAIKELHEKIGEKNKEIGMALQEEAAPLPKGGSTTNVITPLDIDPVPPADPVDVLDIDPVPPADPVFP